MSLIARMRTVEGGAVLNPTQRQWSAIANALRVAARQYEVDARVIKAEIPHCERGQSVGLARTVDQFERQAQEARELADEIES